LGCRIGFRVDVPIIELDGLGFRVQGLGFRVDVPIIELDDDCIKSGKHLENNHGEERGE
jgi:hypothetical protein